MWHTQLSTSAVPLNRDRPFLLALHSTYKAAYSIRQKCIVRTTQCHIRLQSCSEHFQFCLLLMTLVKLTVIGRIVRTVWKLLTASWRMSWHSSLRTGENQDKSSNSQTGWWPLPLTRSLRTVAVLWITHSSGLPSAGITTFTKCNLR
jgi:hypothetical protein